MVTEVELAKVSTSLDNSAVLAGKYSLFSPVTPEMYLVPLFIDFVTLDPNRVLLVEEQSGDLVEINLKERAFTNRVRGRGRCRGSLY